MRDHLSHRTMMSTIEDINRRTKFISDMLIIIITTTAVVAAVEKDFCLSSG